MAAFATTNTTNTTNTTMEPTTFLGAIRAEGAAANVNRMGFNYIMAREGTFGDFVVGNIPFVRRAQSPGKGGRKGGKVTYAQLVAEGKPDEHIEEIFHLCRRKVADMKTGSYRHKMAEEYTKMRDKWDTAKWNSGSRADSLSSHLEKFSKGSKPLSPTGFCAAVGRMMTLARSFHMQGMADASHQKAKEWRHQKKIANDKRATKHNAMKDSMGLAAWNAKKRRDQAASETRKATEISNRPKDVSDFLSWRAGAAGRKYDTAPVASWVTSRASLPFLPSPPFPLTKRLGYASRATLARLVKKYVLDSKASGLEIAFQVDPCDSKTQLFQHVAMGGAVSPLSKTQEVSSTRTFHVSGYYHQSGATSPLNNAFYVNLDDMRASVYMGLPVKYKAFEAWEGYGVKGNPKKATSMKVLFKITPFNIQKFSFVRGGTRYVAEFTGNYGMQHSFVELEAKMSDKLATAAAAAALLAEEEKRRRAKEAREKEARRKTSGNHRDIYNQFFGVGTKQEDPTTKAKVNLAIKLAQGDIDQATFHAAMAALN